MSAALSNVSLLAAELQVKLVDSVIQAIRAADRQSAAEMPVASQAPATAIAPPIVVQPEPRIEPRDVVYLSPHYVPGPVVHSTVPASPHPRVAGLYHAAVPHLPKGPPPVWTVLPPPNPHVQIKRIIKTEVQRPDSKGTLIDLFV